MEVSSSGGNKHVVLMAFGLPIMTTLIVIASMYAGHLMTTRSDRPTNVMVSAATPNIDVNVPQAAPPSVQVSAPPAVVDVHVPQGPAPQVTVNTPPIPPMPAPNITVNPPPAQVTIIEREKDKKEEPRLALSVPLAPPAAAAPAAPATTTAPAPTTGTALASSTTPAAPASAPVAAAEPAKLGEFKSPTTESTPAKNDTLGKPGDPGKIGNDATNALKNVRESLKSAPDKITTPPAKSGQSSLTPSGKAEDLSIDTLYACATQYIEAYCRKNGLDPQKEESKWNRMWRSSVEQAINDNIDSTEQSYINRMVIAKRDYFNIDKATPEKIVEACRIMLRYRDGQLAWLSAMKEALTEDNLKKTVAFLSAGPK